MKRTLSLFVTLLLFAAGAAFRTTAIEDTAARTKALIEKGFDMLYELKFEEARHQFNTWVKANPEDPLGEVATAASYLFEEFYYQHVLTSDFFLDDKRLLGGIEGRPDQGRTTRFREAIQIGRGQALRRLHADPEDADALFALTLATGMQADFAGILEKHSMESLSLTKEASGYAKRLLALQPDSADAWLALGAANYIIGSLPAYKRFFLWFGQIRGNKRLGMEQLQITAEKGHYLKPFAKIFLALAAMREKQEAVAIKQMSDLAARYPDNPLFAAELARLTQRTTKAGKFEGE